MLNSIKNVSKFGVFEALTIEIPLLRFNLFYGWNGSGKSTLSRVFDSFSGISSAAFPDGDFKVRIQDLDYTKTNISTSGLKFATFNQDFVKANLSFEEQRAKSLLFISEEKIEEKRQLEMKYDLLKVAKNDHSQTRLAFDGLNSEISTDLTKIAKNVKSSFGLCS